jgi:hypothetical protein
MFERGTFRLCLQVWRGREGKTWEKRNEQVEEIEENASGELLRLTFLHNTKPSVFGGTKKLHWRRVLGGFVGFI